MIRWGSGGGVVVRWGNGIITWTYTLTDSTTGSPIVGADVWISTDTDGDAIIDSGTTDASGVCTFYLDPDTYYVWRRCAGYNFVNPDIEVVTV